MKTIFIFAFVLAVFSGVTRTAQAQHCPWDGSSIVVCRPVGPDSAGIIPGLRITVLDSAGKPVKLYNQAPAVFLRNVDSNDAAKKKELGFCAGYQYPFVEDNYAVVLSNSFRYGSPIMIRIEDPDGEANGGWFATMTMLVPRNNFVSLCTSNMSWDMPGFRYKQTLVTHLIKTVNDGQY